MSVSLFYNPDLVDQLAACGITRRAPTPGAAQRGFVLARAPAPRGRATVTHVVAARADVTITAHRRVPLGELGNGQAAARAALPAVTEPRTALELVEECARLQRDNQRLTDEVTHLRTEIARLTTGPTAERREIALDDSARRFALLELD